MDLLPQELRKTLPSLYSQESSSAPIVHVKLFTPDTGWTWFITEGSEEDGELAPVRICDRPGGGVGVFSAVRTCKHSRPAPVTGGARLLVSAGAH
jgi:hypothetical protein